MINIHQGFTFKLTIRVLLGFLAVVALPFILYAPIAVSLIVLVCSFLVTFSYGMQIDQHKNTYREYSSFYGAKTGKWQPLNALPYLSVMSQKKGHSTYTMALNSYTYSATQFNVNLLSENHRKRVTVKSFKEVEAAYAYAKEMAEELDKKVVKFNPPVSAATKARKRTSSGRR